MMKPIHAMTCASTLMNVPIVLRIAPAFSEAAPYSSAMIWNCVVCPECLSLWVQVSQRMNKPSPEPRVNHHADSPKVNASWAVPMVH